MILNACKYFTENDLFHVQLANYSHLVSAGILLAIGVYVLFKDRKVLNLAFFIFVAYITLWLIGDWFVWISSDYYLINTFWATLDYLDVCMFFGALYFYLVFIKGQDILNKQKFIIMFLTFPALYLVLSGQSILGFDQSHCESFENRFLTLYRFAVEVGVILAIAVIGIINWRRKTIAVGKRSFLLVTFSIIAFLATFAITGYISSATGFYELQLYGMFSLPIFIMFMVIAINNYDIFELKYFNQQLLAWILIPLIASEFMFLKGATDFILNTFTLIISGIVVYTLSVNIKKENANKLRIEKLNKDLVAANKHLEELNQQKTEFISLASHQLRGPLTAIKGYASMILEGDFGKLPRLLQEAIETMFKSTQSLVVLVGDYLDVSRMDQGKMKYDFTDFDVTPLIGQIINELQPNIKIAGLELLSKIEPNEDFFIHGDEGKIKQVISNLIDNSIKYTPHGTIHLILERDEKDKIRISIKDTGVGISAEVLPKLFERFTRAPDASKTNISGTGLGLFVARKMIEAHRGKIWAESEGKEKGSTFIIELDALHKTPTEINKKLEAKIAEVNRELGE